MQLSPTSQLSSIIKHYLIIENKNSALQNYRLFSDGNPGIVFHLKTPLLQYNHNDKVLITQPVSFVYGQITDFNNLASVGELNMLVIVLQPHALYTLFRLAAYELNNSIVPLTAIFGSKAKNLEEQIAGALNVYDAISIIECFLIKQLENINILDANVMVAIHTIYQHKGIVSIEHILKQIPITERQLERKFKDYIGISPKSIAGIVKFQNFLKNLQAHSSKKVITEVVYKCGYYDQAYLNNYFKRKTGITPLQYKANQNLLAINLIAVS